VGLEPTRPCGHWILSPARLPFRHFGKSFYSQDLASVVNSRSPRLSVFSSVSGIRSPTPSVMDLHTLERNCMGSQAHPQRQWSGVHCQSDSPLAGERDVQALHIEPGSPWENGYAESFHGRPRDEFLAMEVFESVPAARRLTAAWREDYNHVRPQSSLGYVAPVEFARRCAAFASPTPTLQQRSEFTQPRPS
jgi:hypothetical protein